MKRHISLTFEFPKQIHTLLFTAIYFQAFFYYLLNRVDWPTTLSIFVLWVQQIFPVLLKYIFELTATSSWSRISETSMPPYQCIVLEWVLFHFDTVVFLFDYDSTWGIIWTSKYLNSTFVNCWVSCDSLWVITVNWDSCVAIMIWNFCGPSVEDCHVLLENHLLAPKNYRKVFFKKIILTFKISMSYD